MTDRIPGIRRVRSGKGLRYVRPDGSFVRDGQVLARIRSLAIPPAWTDVWISAFANAHLQATGRDARGRKQYRYHARWRERQEESKYERLVPFGESLPRVRRRVARDLSRTGMPREKVLAAVVRLLDTTYLRIGNPEYARNNGSYGLTTLRNRHADVRGSTVKLQFRGKGGKDATADVQDRRVAAVVRRCKDLPGYELFCYVGDDGRVQQVGSGDVNRYLKEIAGEPFTAKDFRTWAGSLLAARALGGRRDGATSEAARTRRVVEAVREVARGLGNTPAVCRKHYVHPALIERYLEGTLPAAPAAASNGNGGRAALRADEVFLLRVLEGAALRKRAAR